MDKENALKLIHFNPGLFFFFLYIVVFTRWVIVSATVSEKQGWELGFCFLNFILF